MDADSQSERRGSRSLTLAVPFRESPLHAESSRGRRFGLCPIFLIEKRHDGIADELVDEASEMINRDLHLREVFVEQSKQILRRHAFRQCRERPKIAEENRYPAGPDVAGFQALQPVQRNPLEELLGN